MSQYLPILCMIILVVLFGSVSFLASTLLAPRRKTTAKTAPYECGIVPEDEPSERFPVKFYLVAMIFIILDVEIIFLYPFTLVFREPRRATASPRWASSSSRCSCRSATSSPPARSTGAR